MTKQRSKLLPGQHHDKETHVEAEVSLQHGAQVLGHVRHAGVQGGHQAGVEGQQIQPAGGAK